MCILGASKSRLRPGPLKPQGRHWAGKEERNQPTKCRCRHVAGRRLWISMLSPLAAARCFDVWWIWLEQRISDGRPSSGRAVDFAIHLCGGEVKRGVAGCRPGTEQPRGTGTACRERERRTTRRRRRRRRRERLAGKGCELPEMIGPVPSLTWSIEAHIVSPIMKSK